MEQFEKIIELIEKESLTTEEQKHLDGSIKSNKDVARLVTLYNSLKTNLPNILHLDTELIGDFVLYKNAQLPDDTIIPILADKIEFHLKNCLVCNEEYKILQKEYEDVVAHLGKTMEEKEQSDETKSFFSSFALNNFSSFRYAFSTIVILGIIYLGLFTLSNFTTPDYNKNIFSTNENGFYVTRGRTSVTFQKGLDAVQKGNYNEAINLFEKDIEDHSHQSSIFYAHFITGLTYLKSAESSFLGLFQSFDNEKVNHAIVNLRIAIGKNSSGNYDNLNLDAHYYLGRAYLLLGEIEIAKEELAIVVESKGKYYNEAKILIEDLAKN
ncbi:MAG: hypothetical protein KJO12_01470 [Ignavibacteria bacterium]|nr:hypothetical protein [Ignavibacteria bacterium]